MMDRDLPHDPQLDGLSTGDAVLRRLAELVAAERIGDPETKSEDDLGPPVALAPLAHALATGQVRAWAYDPGVRVLTAIRSEDPHAVGRWRRVPPGRSLPGGIHQHTLSGARAPSIQMGPRLQASSSFPPQGTASLLG